MAAIIFDLDGTLVDSVPDIHAAVTLMLADHQASPMDMSQVRSFIGNGVPALISKVMEARDEDPADAKRHAQLEATFMRHYTAAPAKLSQLFPGVRKALLKLQGAGHAMALCTNKPIIPARAMLASFELENLLPLVIGGDSLPVRKPDPAPLHAAARAMGADPVLYIGDSEVDAEAAERAAIPLMLFTQGYRKSPIAALTHSATFDHFDELPRLISRFADR
ncbi:phosphoglycolate phosphatase [Pseudotabrizicola alkalilacus]|uniref:Phosphoglycolate phosphatase n=1 Tax=Pseudotabrizicola alkalilacus TaxID=2305252 RepID=A0A411YXX1_9RHOB|nr:phosphoglycolate phosphatase [Pseudotabrizicola alkalilacus]RGP35569.1 phosphoglycolate phosphatase [Pseudotabrizicola alkalilacus]